VKCPPTSDEDYKLDVSVKIMLWEVYLGGVNEAGGRGCYIIRTSLIHRSLFVAKRRNPGD